MGTRERADKLLGVETIEVRYAGVVVGRTSQARDTSNGMFVGIAEPLPVGTLVTLKVGDVVREARVDEVAALPAAPAPTPAPAPRAPEPPPAAGSVPVASAVAAAPAAPVVDAPSAAVASEADASGAISAPLSLAGDPTQQGGGKKRRKTRRCSRTRATWPGRMNAAWPSSPGPSRTPRRGPS
jgi:hypothetical protein